MNTQWQTRIAVHSKIEYNDINVDVYTYLFITI